MAERSFTSKLAGTAPAWLLAHSAALLLGWANGVQLIRLAAVQVACWALGAGLAWAIHRAGLALKAEAADMDDAEKAKSLEAFGGCLGLTVVVPFWAARWALITACALGLIQLAGAA